MRNLALARSLIDAGEADRATFALCAHDSHSAIWRRWEDAKRAVPLPAGCAWADLPASAVFAVRDPAAGGWLGGRYGVGRLS